MKTILGVLVVCLLALVIITATPLVGEIVTLHTHDADDAWQTTPLWIVDLDSGSYLRAGTPDKSGWLNRLRANPKARLEHSAQVEEVTLIESPARRGGELAPRGEHGVADFEGSGLGQLFLGGGVSRDAGSSQHIAQHRRQGREIFRTPQKGETRDVTPHRHLAVGLRLVDRRMGRKRQRKAALAVRRGDPLEVGGTGPRRPMNARMTRLFGERPRPDLFGDVRQHRREQPQ